MRYFVPYQGIPTGVPIGIFAPLLSIAAPQMPSSRGSVMQRAGSRLPMCRLKQQRVPLLPSSPLQREKQLAARKSSNGGFQQRQP